MPGNWLLKQLLQTLSRQVGVRGKKTSTLQKLTGATEKLKLNKSADECGLVAEVFTYIPTNFAAKILHLNLNNDLLSNGHIPWSWRPTLFTMLAKHREAAQVPDFRPIASIRSFYKIFVYMILPRIQACLDNHQPEEQHGFRAQCGS